MKRNKFFVLLVAFVCTNVALGQELLQILDDQQDTLPQYVPATFKMSRIAFGHSTEVRPKNVLEIFVANRFWNLPFDRSQSFVADKMSSRIALEYALSDRLTFGVGGTSLDGLFDSFLKYRLAVQRSDGKGWPFNVTLFQNASYDSSPIADAAIADDFSDRLSYTTQLLISKRFSRDFSLQLSPTLVNRSLGVTDNNPTSHFALGVGARYKLGSHLSLVSEYYHIFNRSDTPNTFDPFAMGVNWELGDLMLQFMLTNSFFMVEDAFLTRTRNNFNFRNPNLNFGFNATYVIHFKNKLKK